MEAATNLANPKHPSTPFASVPLLVLVGAVREAPVVKDGQIVPAKLLTIPATIDHRFIDGFQGAILAKAVRDVFESPEKLEAELLRTSV